MDKTRLLRVHGRVQGVGYREACAEAARALGVAGWVRNRLDGSVEVMLQGPPDALARMLGWLQRGPPAARVDRVEEASLDAAGEEQRTGFERRPTV